VTDCRAFSYAIATEVNPAAIVAAARIAMARIGGQMPE
jgi:hypothetical protein